MDIFDWANEKVALYYLNVLREHESQIITGIYASAFRI